MHSHAPPPPPPVADTRGACLPNNTTYNISSANVSGRLKAAPRHTRAVQVRYELYNHRGARSPAWPAPASHTTFFLSFVLPPPPKRLIAPLHPLGGTGHTVPLHSSCTTLPSLCVLKSPVAPFSASILNVLVVRRRSGGAARLHPDLHFHPHTGRHQRPSTFVPSPCRLCCRRASLCPCPCSLRIAAVDATELT